MIPGTTKETYNMHTEKDEPNLITATLVILVIVSLAVLLGQRYFEDFQAWI